MNTMTIVMPIYNGASTLQQVFDALEQQQDKERVEEIICIDDRSTDASAQMIDDFSRSSAYKVRHATHTKSCGLAASYNEGMHLSTTSLVTLMHQDIVLLDTQSFSKIMLPHNDKTVVVSYPTILHPKFVWVTYNFWQRCYFSRLVDTEVPKLTGKFDCINKNYNLLFDEKTYRTAGEDHDYEVRSKRLGSIVPSGLKIVHIHSSNPNFSVKDWLKKEIQLAECYGVNFRRYFKNTHIKDMILLLTRPLLLVTLLVPVFPIRLLALLALILFTLTYTWRVYVNNFSDIRIILLPLVTTLSVVLYSIYFFKGILYGKQKL